MTLETKQIDELKCDACGSTNMTVKAEFSTGEIVCLVLMCLFLLPCFVCILLFGSGRSKSTAYCGDCNHKNNLPANHSAAIVGAGLMAGMATSRAMRYNHHHGIHVVGVHRGRYGGHHTRTFGGIHMRFGNHARHHNHGFNHGRRMGHRGHHGGRIGHRRAGGHKRSGGRRGRR
jgi:hypothetical protein